jgi:hypothetical protein
MGGYSLRGQVQLTQRVLIAFAVVIGLALAGFAAAFVFARGAAEPQPRFLPPAPTLPDRP